MFHASATCRSVFPLDFSYVFALSSVLVVHGWLPSGSCADRSCPESLLETDVGKTEVEEASVSQVELLQTRELYKDRRPARKKAAAKNVNTRGPTKPHILFFLVDDLGWADVGWNRAEKTIEGATPNMDRLAHEGVILDRHYVHFICSPTRSAIQSGRSPIHVNVLSQVPRSYNPLDPVSGFQGIPRNMTCIAEVMKSAGYSTHMVGKWDVGMATPDHTPAGRGYDSSMVYFHHMNGNWDFCEGTCKGDTGLEEDIRDLWIMHGDIPFPGRPAQAEIARLHKNCSFENQRPDGGICVYEDQMFEERVSKIIRSHNASVPFFIFWATRAVHKAYEPPDEEITKFSFMDYGCSCDLKRKKYASAVSWIDKAIGRVTDTLKNMQMYDNTLIVMSSDNGGQMPTGNNYPLKGGKQAPWEGGIRVPAFISGGFVPQAVRGRVQTNLVASWDWYATFAALANVDPVDRKAAKAGLPPHDSFNQWPILSGRNATPPRTRVEIGSNVGGAAFRADGRSKTTIGGVIIPPHKILIDDNISYAGWTAPQSLNDTSSGALFEGLVESCGRTPETGCLYDVFADPQEHHNLASVKPDVFRKLLAEADGLQKTVFSADRGGSDDAACNAALQQYGGFWGPFLS